MIRPPEGIGREDLPVPWEEACHVNERMHFVLRLKKGERMTTFVGVD